MTLFCYKTEIVLRALECSELHRRLFTVAKTVKNVICTKMQILGSICLLQKLHFFMLDLVPSQAETTPFKILFLRLKGGVLYAY